VLQAKNLRKGIAGAATERRPACSRCIWGFEKVNERYYLWCRRDKGRHAPATKMEQFVSLRTEMPFMKTAFFATLLLGTTALFCSTQATAQYRRYDRPAYRNYRSYHNDGYAYRRPYVSYPRYTYPRYYGGRSGVSVIASLPMGAVSVHIGATPYRYYRGMFYRPYGPQFIITTPPVGIIVPVLPPDCEPVFLNGMSYYRYNDTYYQPLSNNQGYQVIQTPQSAQSNDNTSTAPAETEYEKVVIDGKTYYKKGDTYYKALVNDSGEVTYEAVSGK
jgi:hypothetical protein